MDHETGKEILVYREDPLQKTNQGGLSSKAFNKIVKVFPSVNVARCPVKIFGKYIGLLPTSKSCGKLYLRPRIKHTPAVWFCNAPFGKNKICSNVKTICEQAGISGKFTNHSLRATSASRMFARQVPEQIIKEITGHRSECVRVYKKTNSEILKNASECISGDKVGETGKSGSETGKLVSDAVHTKKVQNETEKKGGVKSLLSVTQMIKNVIKSRMEWKRKSVKGSLSRWAKKVVKCRKRKSGRKHGETEKSKRVVIDVNLNVKCDK